MTSLCEYVHAYMYVNICTHTCKLGVHTTVNLVYMHVNTFPHTCQYIYTLIHTFKYLRTRRHSTDEKSSTSCDVINDAFILTL